MQTQAAPAEMEEAIKSAADALEIGDLEQFRRSAERCIAARIAPARFVHLAMKARQGGFTESGAEILKLYAARHADAPEAIFFELAFQERLAGRHRAAADYLAIANRAPGAGFRTGLNHAHMLFAAAAHADARHALAALRPATPQEAQSIRVMAEFGTYLEKFPLETVSACMAGLKSEAGWLGQREVTARILEAVSARRPFSLIRLGDGEGAFIRLGAEDEAAYPNLYDANRDNRMAMWFGAGFPWRTNGFFEETHGLAQAVRDADIVAVPDLAWLSNAYRIMSISGVPSLANIVRCFDTAETLRAHAFAAASIAKELHLQNRYDEIFRIAKRVSLISCLPDLPALLQAHFGLEAVSFIQIPGEQGSRKALGENVIYGAHYPDVFRRLQAELCKPWAGEVVLVAGGMLGKLYAATIKQHGGIALDIGSLADRWADKKTRPGDDPRYPLSPRRASKVNP